MFIKTGFLGQIGHTDAPRRRNRAGAGSFFVGNDAQQGTFAGAIDAHDGEAFATADVEADPRENMLGAVIFADVLNL